jgi:hypothetical protein
MAPIEKLICTGRLSADKMMTAPFSGEVIVTAGSGSDPHPPSRKQMTATNTSK